MVTSCVDPRTDELPSIRSEEPHSVSRDLLRAERGANAFLLLGSSCEPVFCLQLPVNEKDPTGVSNGKHEILKHALLTAAQQADA